MSRDCTVELRALFKSEKVLELSTIGRHFPERSRTRLVRDLKKINAITSYNHCGKHYTTKALADFNDQGIWQYRGAMFSAHGNLKQTIQNLVDNSSAGMTHNELKDILNLRVHDVLLVMVKDNLIDRKDVHNVYLYVSADPAVSRGQVESRTLPPKRRAVAQTDPMFIIEVLSYALQHPKATAAEAYRHFEGTGATQDDVEIIYENYVRGKKN